METIRYDGRVAVVTGGGNGLGKDYCLQLAARGAKVVVNDLGGSGAGVGASKAAADQVVDEIKAAGGQAVANYDSVASREGGAAIIDTAMKAFGRVDIVINNAGFLRNSRFEDMTDEQIDSVLNVHLKGAFYVSQPAYRVMKDQGYGRLLFTASASGMFGHPWQANYAAAKAGLVGLMNVVSLEGQRHGILANALLPTAATRLVAEMHQEWMEVTNVASVMKSVDYATLGPLLTAEHNTTLALYLVSEHCQSTHACYSNVGGRYAHVMIASTDGWSNGSTKPATLEELAANWAQVTDNTRHHQPHSVYAEFLPATARIKAAQG